jgi:DNA polymerase-3 subunit alpha
MRRSSENTSRVAKRCSLEIKLGASMLPAYPVPAGSTTEDFLREEARAGSRRGEEAPALRAAAAHGEQYAARLELELGVICSMGFAGYFLIVADFIRWARENGVPVGPGPRLRRRLAGGLRAGHHRSWIRSSTTCLFERFLNPERVSMPDFDVDFCMEGRDRVIEYVANKYGRERVSQIITYGTLGGEGRGARRRPRARPQLRLRRQDRQARFPSRSA